MHENELVAGLLQVAIRVILFKRTDFSKEMMKYCTRKSTSCNSRQRERKKEEREEEREGEESSYFCCKEASSTVELEDTVKPDCERLCC